VTIGVPSFQLIGVTFSGSMTLSCWSTRGQVRTVLCLFGWPLRHPCSWFSRVIFKINSTKADCSQKGVVIRDVKLINKICGCSKKRWCQSF
jgi:hypothetical protein